ncbi:ribosomal RNA-processing protein 7-domain-containing protein [Fennellomyces sp. T-0311]|nr:ribosomal RNA-processing protein 7-domain-containing protein [Fennellomyces sp. T-0311]
MGKKKSATTDSEPDLQEFNGFKVLPVVIAKNCRHYLYFKKHEARTSTTDDRSLFVINLPADTTDSHLHSLFKEYGQVEQVIYPGMQLKMDDNRSKLKKRPWKKAKKKEEEEEQQVEKLRRILESGASAHVVFKTEDGLQRVLDMPHHERKWKPETKQQTMGLKRYMREYNMARPDHNVLQQEVNAFMLKFQASEYEKEREAKERMNKMDDDGFTVVTRVKKGISSAAVPEQRPKKKMGDLVDFYRFQTRQKKENELLLLRKRFEEDKQKIEQQKQARRFKPY